ncbi:MAG: AAA family ATPase, partial [Alphaproteobacteria bacterium]|nr:AAA family ATPase [Alphaproteobacteria bacterium]
MIDRANKEYPPLHFTKLHLTGFKSFVDRTDLDIAPGLTGIVGPNGCGKSNLVEAIRWTMGETSAKQMRGGEMNDVIFGGTAHRPPRDLAEVVLHLDNSARTAPPEFNGESEIQISRRIERDMGSQYRINGAEVRAKDVQILFADLATGPRSTALVSQGRVAALINAKPAGRRLLLEEAAGITGLHSRRHEAELKLRAAATNLDRLEDVVTALEVQLDGLKKQARQAKRYRSLSDRLRETEAVLLHRRYELADGQVRAAQAEFKVADKAVTEKTRAAATAATVREKSAASLGPLRDTEGEAAARLQRLNHAGQELDAEQQRNEAAIASCDSRLGQIDADHARETILEKDAAAALAGLAQAIEEIAGLAAGEAEALGKARAGRDAANKNAEAADKTLAALTEAVASAEARRAGIAQQIEEISARLTDLGTKKKQSSEALASLGKETVDDNAIAAAEAALADTSQQLDTARRDLNAVEQQRIDAEGKAQTAREARQQAQEHRGRLAAEAQALTDLLSGTHDESAGGAAPVIDRMTVAPGYEIALGAALGADLDAPVANSASGASRHWRARTKRARETSRARQPDWGAGVEPL